ncbi:MAG: DUF2085 domain-containing protein [Promethearchaeota archaeon]
MSDTVSYLGYIYENPSRIMSFPLSYWLGPLSLIFLAKFFNRNIVLIAGIGIGFYFEAIISPNPIQFIYLAYLGIIIVVESLKPYEGGDYSRGNLIVKQLGLSMLGVLIIAPGIYFGFRFDPDYIFALHPESLIRLYITLVFIVNHFFIVFTNWLILWVVDRKLTPYFPLDPKDQATLNNFNRSEFQDESNPSTDYFQDFLPQPGEVYLHILTHHVIEEDDHTVVLKVGKTRLYLCTRCTAMIVGVIFAFFLAMILFGDLQVSINTSIAFWLGTFLPLFPLLDWGLQALRIRKATTTSRLITGFILGFTMQLIPLAMGKNLNYVFIVIGYFVIFGILYYFQMKLAQKWADQQALEEFIQIKDPSDPF